MKLNKSLLIALGMLVGISALAYLPLVREFGYYFDDWYLTYDARTHGAQFFHSIFSGDRPGRAFVMTPLYTLFGLNPLPYNISAYLFRFLGGASLFWILKLLWPQKNFLAITTAILFTIYPGFLSQYNAIDYQSHIFALFLALLSVASTLKSIMANERKTQIIWGVLSILLGWAYLSQMEYFIGIEAFRLACIVMIVWRGQQTDIRRTVRDVVLKWFPFTAIPLGFLVWRILFFQAERRATDIGSQVGRLFESPLTGLRWLTYLLQDFFNVLLVPWALPLSTIVFPMRLQNQLFGFMLAAIAIVIFVMGIHWLDEKESETTTDPGPRGMREELLVGFISIVGGLVPVIAANRHIILPDYSRYTLIASVGAVILVVAFIEQLSMRSLRIGAASVLVAVGVLIHYGNSVKAAAETDVVREFWWQVAWRAPQIKSGTTLSVSYPNVSIQEDYFIWGPANHIYFPKGSGDDLFKIALSSVVLNEENVSRIIAGRGEETYHKRSGDTLVVDFNNVLVMTQANENSCLRIIDGNAPDLSVYDQHRVMLIGPNSKLENVIPDGDSPIPPALIFGREPQHNWCFYYQKASLAQQQGDWETVTALYEEAVKAEFHPNDQIELMPFLKAYAVLGDRKQVKDISTRINTHVFYKEQACRNLNSMTENGNPLTPDMKSYVDELFCQ